MKRENPFSLTFGKEPLSIINRIEDFDDIVTTFCSNSRVSQAYIITGVRGSGKTVLLNSVGNYFEKEKDWVVVTINPERDILEQLVSKIYSNANVKHLFIDKTLSISLYGISFTAKGNNPISDPETILEIMVKSLAKHDKKLLILIDEVTNSQQMRIFAHTFQTLIGKQYPVFLLMTGLYFNVYRLQNEETLTFLLRTPKINLKPLDLISIKNNYLRIFDISNEEATKMAKLTNGYPFAYQVLGYLLFEKSEPKIDDDTITKYETYLREYVYEKLWLELSNNEKNILKAFVSEKDQPFSELLEKTGLKKETLSFYKDSLVKKGILDSVSWGKSSISLPRFFEFVQDIKSFE